MPDILAGVTGKSNSTPVDPHDDGMTFEELGATLSERRKPVEGGTYDFHLTVSEHVSQKTQREYWKLGLVAVKAYEPENSKFEGKDFKQGVYIPKRLRGSDPTGILNTVFAFAKAAELQLNLALIPGGAKVTDFSVLNDKQLKLRLGFGKVKEDGDTPFMNFYNVK